MNAGRIWKSLIFINLLVVGMSGAAPVRVIVNEAETGQITPARAYLFCDDQQMLDVDLPSYNRGEESHIILTGDDVLELSGARCEITVEKGLEFLPVRKVFPPEESAKIHVELSRWVHMNKEGWFSADMHVHRDPAELRQILLAEDLNFAPTITYHVWSEQVSEPFPAATDFPVIVDSTHFYTANSQEVERIQGGPGAVVLFAKELPIPFTGNEYYPPAAHFTRKVHAQQGYVSGDKLFWLDTVVNVPLGEIDFIELNCNHFLPYDVDTDLPPWSHWPVEMGYYGDKQFALWKMDFYYKFLNCGFKLPLSGGSASGVKATPVGYNRVYAYLEDRLLRYDTLLSALADGRTFSTNGPIVDLRVNGRIAPGLKLQLKKGERVTVEATVQSRKGLAEVEIVVNGRVYRSYEGAGQRTLSIKEDLSPSVSSWIALRAFEPADGTVVFAHTSPCYLELEKQPVLVPEDARYLLQKTDQLIDYTRSKGDFIQRGHLEETLELYKEARAIYARLGAKE